HRSHPASDVLAVTHQGAMLALPGRGHVRLRDYVTREELSKYLRVQAGGLLGGLGNDPQLLWGGQHDFRGERFHELYKPVLDGRGINNHVEWLELPDKFNDLVGFVAVQSLSSLNAKLIVHNAGRDNLLVEVDADRVHRRAPSLGKQEET